VGLRVQAPVGPRVQAPVVPVPLVPVPVAPVAAVLSSSGSARAAQDTARAPIYIPRMQQKIITDVLREAVRIEGSSQALASRLHAPETTLGRWVSGRAQMPLRAFLAVLELVMREEARAAVPADADSAARNAEPLVFRLGPLTARCARCDGTAFAANGAALRRTSRLRCIDCGEAVVHGDLLAQLARDAVHQTRASSARTRRAMNAARESTEHAQRRLNEVRLRLERRDEG